jgi:hypothetical protein
MRGVLPLAGHRKALVPSTAESSKPEQNSTAARCPQIAKWTLMPAGNGEGLQVLRYEIGAWFSHVWVAVALAGACGPPTCIV